MVCRSFAKDMQYLEILINCGVQYITYMVDAALVSLAYKNINESFSKMTSHRKENK